MFVRSSSSAHYTSITQTAICCICVEYGEAIIKENTGKMSFKLLHIIEVK
jgi:hypothetical protein